MYRALQQVQHVLLSPLPPVSCHCSSATSSFLHDLHLCDLCHLCTSSTPVAFACSFVDSLQSDVHGSLVSFFSRAFAVFLRGQSDYHWSTRVGFLLSGCRDCRDLVDEDVFFQRNEKLFVHHCRAAEYEVQQILISYLTVKIFSSSLIVPKFFSNVCVFP